MLCSLSFFWKKKLIFPKYRNRPKTIPCLVSHLLLSQVRVKKGTILFCLLAENQGVPGHEFPPSAENCVQKYIFIIYKVYIYEPVRYIPVYAVKIQKTSNNYLIYFWCIFWVFLKDLTEKPVLSGFWRDKPVRDGIPVYAVMVHIENLYTLSVQIIVTHFLVPPPWNR